MASARTWIIILLGVFVVGCGGGKEGKGGKKDKKGGTASAEAEKKRSTTGIDPLLFKCNLLVTLNELSAILDGTIKVAEVAFEPPPGTVEPCNYLRIGDEDDAGLRSQEAWSFDLDCREDALATAEKLFLQYSSKQPPDAGPTVFEVEVGKRGMDHHGQALLFIDDDTPCYVRVRGPSEEGRKKLAQLLARKLDMSTAPMRRRRGN